MKNLLELYLQSPAEDNWWDADIPRVIVYLRGPLFMEGLMFCRLHVVCHLQKVVQYEHDEYIGCLEVVFRIGPAGA